MKKNKREINESYIFKKSSPARQKTGMRYVRVSIFNATCVFLHTRINAYLKFTIFFKKRVGVFGSLFVSNTFSFLEIIKMYK